MNATGQPPQTPADNYVTFESATLSRPEQYKLLCGAVVPRPIALVTTLGSRGLNAAPFSFFTAIGTDPAAIMFSVGHRGKAIKDTTQNIQETGEFVVHITDVAAREKVNICGIDFGPSVDEVKESGFRTAPSLRVRPPRLIDCPIQLECKLLQIVPVGHYDMIVGEVVLFHFRSDVIKEGNYIDFAKLDPLGRLAGPSYAHMNTQIHMPRRPVPPGMEAAVAE